MNTKLFVYFFSIILIINSCCICHAEMSVKSLTLGGTDEAETDFDFYYSPDEELIIEKKENNDYTQEYKENIEIKQRKTLYDLGESYKPLSLKKLTGGYCPSCINSGKKEPVYRKVKEKGKKKKTGVFSNSEFCGI